MKKENSKVAQIIKSTGIAIGAILIGLALVMHASAPAVANNASDFNFEDEVSFEKLNALPQTSSGRYMMQFQAEYNDEEMSWYILVWDTNTGRSKMYYGSNSMGKITTAASSFNLPSSPL